MPKRRWLEPAVILLILFGAVAFGSWRCPILAVTGHPCPGCGMTRALTALLRLDFAAAWGYHPMLFLLLPAAALSLVGLLRRWSPRRQILLWGVFVAVWLLWFLIHSAGNR